MQHTLSISEVRLINQITFMHLKQIANVDGESLSFHTVSADRYIQTFRRNLFPPSSEPYNLEDQHRHLQLRKHPKSHTAKSCLP
jgi:hypothetical protein